MARKGERHLNQALAEVMPGRTVEAIKGQRWSSRYKELLASVLPGARPSPSAGAQSAPSPPPDLRDLRHGAYPTGLRRPQPTPTSDAAYPQGQRQTNIDEANSSEQPTHEAYASPAEQPPSDMSARSSASRPPSDIWRERICEYLQRLGNDPGDARDKLILMQAQYLIIQEAQGCRTRAPEIRALPPVSDNRQRGPPRQGIRPPLDGNAGGLNMLAFKSYSGRMLLDALG